MSNKKRSKGLTPKMKQRWLTAITLHGAIEKSFKKISNLKATKCSRILEEEKENE